MNATAAREILEPQYGDASGYVITDERDATTATVFTPDAEVVVMVRRSPRGKWMWDSSDHFASTAGLTRARWDSVDAVLETVTARTGVTFQTVTL